MGDSRAAHILWSEGNAEIAIEVHIINLKIPHSRLEWGIFWGTKLFNHVPTKVSEGIPTIVGVIGRATKAPDGFCPT